MNTRAGLYVIKVCENATENCPYPTEEFMLPVSLTGRVE